MGTLLDRRLSRRLLLRRSAAAGVGAAALALVGCSSDEEQAADLEQQQSAAQTEQQTGQQAEQPPEPPQQSAAQQQQATQQDAADAAQQDESQQQAEPEPSSGPAPGGVLRAYLPIERFDTWDPHRSRFRYAQSIHSLVYSRIMQPADPHSGELAADLCALPETPDQTTYVFTLNPDARFWDRSPTDGRNVEVDDIRLNIERQQAGLDAEGEPDPRFYRSRDWNRAAFAAGDEGTFTLSSDAPDAPFLGSVIASPFAWIISAEAIEESAPGWLDAPLEHSTVSGSGPYFPLDYVPGFELSLRRSDNWWGAEVWPEAIIFSGGPTDGIVESYQQGALDRADFPLTNETVELLREQNAEHTPFELPLDAPIQLLAPRDSDPNAALGDPRVIRALSIALDRRRLIDRLYGGRGRPSGPLPWYLEGWALSDDRLAAFPGYRTVREDDLAEARQLIAAAGGAEMIAEAPLVTADLLEGFFPGVGAFLRDQLQEATGLTLDLEFRPFAEALDQLQGGERFLFFGWGAAPSGPDPTDAWRETLHSEGAQNWGGLADAELDGLIEQMRGTFDLDARRDLCQQAQMRLLSGEAGGWVHNLANGEQLGVSQPWLHLDPRALSYAWSTQHLATSWLDTSEASAYPTDARPIPEPPSEEPVEAPEASEEAE